jgi:hypothetical protein
VEGIVVFGLLLLLAVVAPRFGYDSRAGLRSNEENLASLGVTWTPGNVPSPTPVSAAAAPHWRIGQGWWSTRRIIGISGSQAASLLK